MQVTKSELDLFSLPPTQIALQSGSYVTITPQQLTNEHRIKISHKVSEGYFADLAKSYFTFKVRIQGADAANKKVAPINLIGHTAMEQVSIAINGETITDATTTYAYEAEVAAALSYGSDAKKSHLALAGWEKDEAGKMDHYDPTNGTNNKGLINRAKGISTGGTKEYLMRPFNGIFQQDRLFPSGTRIDVTFIPSKSTFNLMADAEDGSDKYKTVISDMELHMRQVKPLPSVLASIITERENKNLLYPFRKLSTTPLTIPTGNQSLTRVINEGPMPRRVWVVMVEEAARFGSYKLNPLNFQHFDTTDIYLSVNSEAFPKEHLKPNFGRDIFKECYFTLFSQMGCMFDDCGIDLTLNEYKNGHTIFAFDLTADMEDGAHREVRKNADIKLHLTLGSAHGKAIDVLCIKEYESILEIDKNDKVYIQ